MPPSSPPALWPYRLLAGGALIGTWTFNLRFMLEGHGLPDFLRLAYASNALAAVSVDLLLCVFLLFPWMIREARRYQIKHLWAYLLFSAAIAISVTFPLFLAARAKAIASQGEKRGPTKLTALYPVMGAVSLVLCNLFTVRFFLYEGRSVTAFVRGWFANDAGASLALDLIFLGAALLLLLITEARHGHVRSAALYIAMTALGLAFALPWMLRDIDTYGAPNYRGAKPG